MTERSVLVRIRGRVQGVGFRVWACEKALEIGVRGWIRNEADGSVTAVVVGPAGSVDGMIERLRTGPRGAKVTDMALDSSPEEVSAQDFQILR